MGLKDLAAQLGEGDEVVKVGQSNAFKNKWIGKEGAGFVKLVTSRLLHLT